MKFFLFKNNFFIKFPNCKMKNALTVFLLKMVIIFVNSSKGQNVTYCESYSAVTCKSPIKEDCVTLEKCEVLPNGHNHCFTLWEFNPDTGVADVHMKGCFSNNKDCYEKPYCVERNKDDINQLYFCCCNGDLCNHNITYTNLLEENHKVPVVASMSESVESNFLLDPEMQIVISVFIFCMILCIFIAVSLIWFFRKNKSTEIDEVSNAEKGQSQIVQATNPPDPAFNIDNKIMDISADPSIIGTELLSKISTGRFGTIWKSRRKNGETVAVKAFPLRVKQSWKTELEIFHLPGMRHECLLNYIGACRVGDGLESQFWLITSYCEKGSLHDYLKEHTVSWTEMLEIGACICSGLTHLHQEIGLPSNPNYKPTVVHRDFKSTNVLLDANLRAYVADFDLSLIIRPDDNNNSQLGRVGTIRYMAPEVLDGAIYFRKTFFIAIDMYACGLVLWELASRCQVDDKPVADYQLPFEKEVGLKPSLENMQECVVYQRCRPSMPVIWKEHKGLSFLYNTMEECWDQDADARISASCVLSRIRSQQEETYFDTEDRFFFPVNVPTDTGNDNEILTTTGILGNISDHNNTFITADIFVNAVDHTDTDKNLPTNINESKDESRRDETVISDDTFVSNENEVVCPDQTCVDINHESCNEESLTSIDSFIRDDVFLISITV